MGNPLDQDNDGILDFMETMPLIGSDTDPTKWDSDGDGLSDGQEVSGFEQRPTGMNMPYWVQTDPNNPDTDGDGATDGLEYYAGSQALDPDDVPETY